MNPTNQNDASKSTRCSEEGRIQLVEEMGLQSSPELFRDADKAFQTAT